MKKVIVLGANGQLGQTINDFSNDSAIKFHFFSKSELDITDKKSLESVFLKGRFDYCINCAAYTNVEAAEMNTKEAFLINAYAVKNIAEVCQRNTVRLIHISTDYVFNGEKRKPYNTEDSTNPINEYGKSKLKGELYIQKYLKQHYIIRTSWLYALHGKNFLKTIITKVKEDVSLNITTKEIGTPTSCIDLTAFILYIIKADAVPYGMYHFSANGSTTWFGFAQEIARNFSRQQLDNIRPVVSFKTRASRPKYSVLDLKKTEKFYRELDSWQTSVKTIVENYKKLHA